MSTATQPGPEYGSPEWHALCAARRRERDLEELEEMHRPELLDLYETLVRADAEVDAAKAREKAARAALADAIALAKGIRPGVIVAEEKKRGWGIDATKYIARYQVTDYCLSMRTDISLKGHIIRKDGTPGEVRSIGSDWRLEKDPA